MKYIDEFRSQDQVAHLVQKISIESKPFSTYRFMEFCGGHTHALFKFGIKSLLPNHIHFLHGPGCPVCVIPIHVMDTIIHLAQQPQTIICTFGDVMRVPGSSGLSLHQCQAQHHSIQMIASPLDVISIAQSHPESTVVFLAIGFETTAPATAVLVQQAHQLQLSNLKIYCNHVLSPPAIQFILNAPETRESGTISIDGFIGPAHVSAIIGSQSFSYFCEEFHKPVVISGFEPIDILQSVLMLIRQVNNDEAKVETQYSRAVNPKGNEKAKQLLQDVFQLRSVFEWRGLGPIPYSAYKLSPHYANFDAESYFNIAAPSESKKESACCCGKILRGIQTPLHCPLFSKACTPEHPIGPCMVSSEGACAAYYLYGDRKETS